MNLLDQKKKRRKKDIENAIIAASVDPFTNTA
jgi:hypothetical protein